MIVKRMRDGTYTIVGMTYALLEDLVSAYDNAPVFLFSFSDPDLYGCDDPAEPLRKAIADAQLTYS